VNQFDTVQLIALLGWLILAGSALASFRLGWKDGLRMALIWGVIFVSVYLLFSIIR
jgi:hypothetical protein